MGEGQRSTASEEHFIAVFALSLMAEATNRGCLYAFTLWDFVSSGSPSRPLTMQGMTGKRLVMFCPSSSSTVYNAPLLESLIDLTNTLQSLYAVNYSRPSFTEYEMNLFGKKKVAPTVSLQDAIKSLKSATEACLKREVYLDREKEAARIEGAKKLKAKDKNGAMFYLKRMRALEKELNMLYGKRHNLDTLVMSLESASFDKTLVSAMASAHEASKTLIKDSDVDKVQDMVADLQESMRNVEDIGNALAEVRLFYLNYENSCIADMVFPCL